MFIDSYLFEKGLTLLTFIDSIKIKDRAIRNQKLILTILLVDLLNFDHEIQSENFT